MRTFIYKSKSTVLVLTGCMPSLSLRLLTLSSGTTEEKTCMVIMSSYVGKSTPKPISYMDSVYKSSIPQSEKASGTKEDCKDMGI